MRSWVPVLAFAGALAACNGEGAADPDPGATATATPSPTATPSIVSSGGARSVAEETDDFLFEYSYPAAAGRIPELASLLDIWLEQRRKELAEESVEARRDARAEGFPYNKHSYTAEWKVVSDLPGFLSLSADIATYAGGAHGNYRVESLVWDKQAEKAMDAIRLFTSPAAFEKALGQRFCDALDREREQRRGDEIAEDSADSFDQCPAIDELEVVVGSSNSRTFDRLSVHAEPYVAGAYAEGAYAIELPVDRAVLAAVKPEYREAFSARN